MVRRSSMLPVHLGVGSRSTCVVDDELGALGGEQHRTDQAGALAQRGAEHGGHAPPSRGRGAAARSRAEASSCSPARAMSPPTTTTGGLSRLTMLARPQPRCRPASSSARWAAMWPSRAASKTPSRSAPGQLGGHHLQHRARRGVGLQAATAAAAAQRALLVEGEVADLAGRAARAVEEPVVDDDAGADAGGDLHEDRAGVAARRAAGGARRSRRGWRRCRPTPARRGASRRPCGC